MVAKNSMFASVVSPRQQVAKNTPLPDDFTPTEWSVICGRGRECFNHVGNRRFRGMLEKYCKAYVEAPTRTDKSMVVIEIVNNFRRAMPLGAFVKKNPKTLKWFDVGDQQAREKVGHAIREATAGNKRSNSNSPKAIKSCLKIGSSSLKTELPKPPVFTKSFSMPVEVVSNNERVIATNERADTHLPRSRSLSSPPPPACKFSLPLSNKNAPISLVDVMADISSALARARSEHAECLSGMMTCQQQQQQKGTEQQLLQHHQQEEEENDAQQQQQQQQYQQEENAFRASIRLSIDSTMGNQLLEALDLDEADQLLLESEFDVCPVMRL